MEVLYEKTICCIAYSRTYSWHYYRLQYCRIYRRLRRYGRDMWFLLIKN